MSKFEEKYEGTWNFCYSFKRKTEHQKGTTNRGGGYRNKNHTLPREFSLKKKRGRKLTSKGTEN
jgi:hypothetical protein